MLAQIKLNELLVSEIPSLWEDFIWSRYALRDEKHVKKSKYILNTKHFKDHTHKNYKIPKRLCIEPTEQAIKYIALLLNTITLYHSGTKITTCSKPFYFINNIYSSLTGLITTAFGQRSTNTSMKCLIYNILWDSPRGEEGSL